MKALVLESDPEHASRCREALEEAGYAVIEARSPAEAAADAAQIRLALCDPAATSHLGRLREILPAEGVTWLGMTDVHLGSVNRDLAILSGSFADLFERPVPREELVGWARRVLGDPADRTAPSATEAAAARARAEKDTLEAPPADADPASAVSARDAATPASAVDAASIMTPAPARAAVRVPRALDPEAVRAEGEFEDSPWLSVLTHVQQRGFTGDVLLSDGIERLVLSFSGGELASAESDRRDLPAWLRENGIVSPAGERAMREAASTTGAAWGAVLDYGRRGLGLDRGNVEKAFVLANALLPFSWTQGRYAIRPGAVDSRPLLGAPELEAFVYRALREAADREEVQTLMRPFRREAFALRPEAQDPLIPVALPSERRVLAAMKEEGRFVAEGEMARDATVQTLLFALVAGGKAGIVD